MGSLPPDTDCSEGARYPDPAGEATVLGVSEKGFHSGRRGANLSPVCWGFGLDGSVTALGLGSLNALALGSVLAAKGEVEVVVEAEVESLSGVLYTSYKSDKGNSALITCFLGDRVYIWRGED